jgi:hypothetical protein
VFQHFLTSLVPSQLLLPSGRIKVQLLPNRRQPNEEVVGGEFAGSRTDLPTFFDLVEDCSKPGIHEIHWLKKCGRSR